MLNKTPMQTPAPARTAHLIANTRSGKGKGQAMAELGQKLCDELGIRLQVHSPEGPKDLENQARAAVKAAKEEGGIVIAAGGDGTIRSVAAVAAGTGVRFGVVACGTFNFFARAHALPEEAEAAFRLALTGNAQPVRLGSVNGEIFLVNASLGLYAKSIEERETATSKFGRRRLVVILSTIRTFFSRHHLLDVTFVAGRKSQRAWTPMIFIGNNSLQLRNLSLPVARCLDHDLLAMVMMKPVRRRDLITLLVQGLFRMMDRAEQLTTSCVESIRIHSRQKQHRVALDGEMFDLKTPLEIQSLPDALMLVKAEDAPAEAEVPTS
jgi:diacylglycerol kinase family enzyme